MESEDQQVV